MIHIKLFESFIKEDIDLKGKNLKYTFSRSLGYTNFYMEIYMKGLFLSTPCSLVKNVTDEIAIELEDQGYDLTMLEYNYSSPLSKEEVAAYKSKVKERGYKLCKIRYAAQTDIPTGPEYVEYVCKYFAKRLMEKLAYAEPENVTRAKNLDLDKFESVMVSIKSSKESEEILYW